MKTLEEQKALILYKIEILQLAGHTEEAIDLAYRLKESLPEDEQLPKTLERLNIPLQARD